MKPMLCDKASPEEIKRFSSDRWSAEAKLDGWRFICHRRGSTIKMIAGRNAADYTGKLPHLETTLLSVLPEDTMIDCELLAQTGDIGAVQTAMRTNGVHWADDLTLVIFDVLRVAGFNTMVLAWKDRRRLVERLVLPEDNERVMVSPLMDPSEECLQAVLDFGFEGLVLKKKDSRYVQGRSSSWVKIKPQQTCDALVIGFKLGKSGGAWDGMVGAFEVRLSSGKCTTVKCGTDARHIEASERPDLWLNQVIEIRHHGISKDGIPRHPQFWRVRDDRDPADFSS